MFLMERKTIHFVACSLVQILIAYGRNTIMTSIHEFSTRSSALLLSFNISEVESSNFDKYTCFSLPLYPSGGGVGLLNALRYASCSSSCLVWSVQLSFYVCRNDRVGKGD